MSTTYRHMTKKGIARGNKTYRHMTKTGAMGHKRGSRKHGGLKHH